MNKKPEYLYKITASHFKYDNGTNFYTAGLPSASNNENLKFEMHNWITNARCKNVFPGCHAEIFNTLPEWLKKMVGTKIFHVRNSMHFKMQCYHRIEMNNNKCSICVLDRLNVKNACQVAEVALKLLE